jgi:hypothetical protein
MPVPDPGCVCPEEKHAAMTSNTRMIGNFRNAIILIILTSSNWVKRFASVRANATGSQASSLTRQVGILPAFFSAGWKPAGRERLGSLSSGSGI